MDQEEKIDFKALRAKFQDEEFLLKQPRMKPALPEKPKVVPPPQSPSHCLPAGARPSLLTSIHQTLEGKTPIAPKVVFKDDKVESKKPLLETNTKKEKNEAKLKKDKDKSTKGSKEKLEDDSLDQKQKNSKNKKMGSAELVPAAPPPKGTTKKGFLGFRKSKRDSVEVWADSILDTPSSDGPRQAPLIPVPSDNGDLPAGPETSTPKVLLPNIPTIHASSSAVEIATPSIIPACPAFTPPPAFIPDNPIPKHPTPESETPLHIETPTLLVSSPVSQNEIIPSRPITVSTPLPIHAISSPPLEAFSSSPSPPEPVIAADSMTIDEAEMPPHPIMNPPSTPSSPKPASPISALERAEDMNVGKRTPQCDWRIFSALEKALKRNASHQTNPTTSNSTPPPGDPPSLSQSPTSSLPELPPIDYEDRAGNPLPKPSQLNSIDHREVSPVLEDIAEEGSDARPELLVVLPPPPRKFLPDPDSLGPAPEKPERPPSVNLSQFIPPAEASEIHPPPPQFAETSITAVPAVEDVGSDTHSPELPASDRGSAEFTCLDTPDGQNMPEYEFYKNGIHSMTNQNTPVPESSLSTSHECPPQSGIQAQVPNSVCESTESMYEDLTVSKKKGKTEGGKKRKGPPKNPYAEMPQERNEEKNKTGRFGRSDKQVEGPDEKEMKKKEKQRLEKQRKEQKEKQEKEKKEQKEREKRENDKKKKFKITGQEDTLYEAKVTVTTKGRKDDLPVKSGDHISIIRTTSCPKGKWLARDSSNNYGYVSVDHVELDIKEMLELGKKAANTHKSMSSAVETDMTSAGSRLSNHYPLSAESFTDDSEEWTGDDEEPLSPPPTADLSLNHTRTLSMPNMGIKDLNVNHQHSHSDMSADNSSVQARHDALQKLATFFHSTKPVEPAARPCVSTADEMDFDPRDMIIIPPPDLYADVTVE